MNTAAEFKRNLVISSALHALAFAVLFLSVAFAPVKKIEPIQWLSPADFAAESSGPPVGAPEPPKKAAPRLVEPTPSLPQPRLAQPPQPTLPKPEIAPLPKTPKPLIEVSKKLVTRPKQTASASQPQPKQISSSTEQWKKQVAQKLQTNVGVGAASAPSGSSGKPDPFAWYYALVRDAMFRNWREPALSQALTTQAIINVARDGRVVSSRITVSSGNATMDESVRECLRQVTKLDPLPVGLGGASVEIVIDFKLHGGE